ncbi:hypothetical protein, partial [Shigella sp. FC2125]|uniref:hypothetical protein n=1 Tax=Shigella sp. FC2125 TaxID=1898679 RepID=UPI001C0A6882
FVHGSGSSRHSPRNQSVARCFNEMGLATLLFDLLTKHEQPIDEITRQLRFDIPLLSQRLTGVIDQLSSDAQLRELRIGLFVHGSGSSRHSPRNQSVARCFNEMGLATLLFDL